METSGWRPYALVFNRDNHKEDNNKENKDKEDNHNKDNHNKDDHDKDNHNHNKHNTDNLFWYLEQSNWFRNRWAGVVV